MKERKPIVGFWNWLLLFLAIAAFLMQHYYIFIFLLLAFGVIVFYRRNNPDKIKGSSLSVWKKTIIAVIVVLATFLFAVMSVPDKSDNRPGTSNTSSAKITKKKKKEKEMLRILNVWASVNNNYGKVKFDDGTPTLILNDETANLSKNELKAIVTQFSNKVRAQKEMNKLKLDDPVVYDEEGTPIAVWTGSTLELTK